nr:hypothetical protein [Tanacetum cinerariifolium]
MSKSDIVFEEIKMMFQKLMERLNEDNQAKIEEMNQVTHTSEPSRRFNSSCYDDNDDYDYEESTITLSDIISQIPSSIVITTSPPVLPIKDLQVSLIMGNEELNTITEKESKEFIKSSIEDLVLIPSESEDTSGSDNFTSSDDESLSDEDVPDDKVTIYSNPLFEFDDEYISCDDVELLLHRYLSTPMMSVSSILEGFTDEPPLKENDDLFDLEPKNDDWKKILYDAPINNLMSKGKNL